jgi:hypothetical protein
LEAVSRLTCKTLAGVLFTACVCTIPFAVVIAFTVALGSHIAGFAAITVRGIEAAIGPTVIETLLITRCAMVSRLTFYANTIGLITLIIFAVS